MEAAPPVALRGQLLAEVDRRVLGTSLRHAARDPRPAIRRLALLGVARLHQPTALPLMRDGLRDPEPAVRRAAALGLGALEAAAPPQAERLLLGAVAAETVEENRAVMLWDLGRIGGEASLPALRQGLSDEAPAVREGACRGFGAMGLAHRSIETPLLQLVAARVVDDPSPAVRLQCVHALIRVEPPEGEAAQGIGADLGRATRDSDARVRALAARALGRYAGSTDALVARTADADWQVAVHAFRTLAKRGQQGVYARALGARLGRAAGDPTGTELHVWRAALDVPRGLAKKERVHAVAVGLLATLSAEGATRDRGLAHCAVARLVDLGRGWPGQLLECGLGQVPEPERQIAMAHVLAETEGSEPQRIGYLRRLYAQGDRRVREAVLAAATHVARPDPVGALVLQGLRAEEDGILTAACDALDILVPRWRRATGPILSVRPAGTPLAPQRRRGPTDQQIGRALSDALTRLADHGAVEGMISCMGAVETAAARQADARVLALALHPNRAVRERARQVLTAFTTALPEGDPPAPPNALTADGFSQVDALRATIRTNRGEVTIELLPDEAPGTVARFLGLARAGFFDGLSFHRVVPAFVIQGGDPAGDGYGGPGWTQRCEDNRLRYDRGTLGMALAGRDTGGSQFFITHSPQPHLDGRYTAFGRVVEGMDVVDAIQQGDRIERIEVLGTR